MLARDIAAVLVGVRAAVMIDYIPMSAADMLAIIDDILTHATARHQTACKLKPVACEHTPSLTPLSLSCHRLQTMLTQSNPVIASFNHIFC